MNRKTGLQVLIVGLATLLASAGTADEPTPKTQSSAGGAVHVQTKISHGYVPQNSTREMWATVTLKAGEAPEQERRAPLNVALVIDRSTSMSGGKLEKAKEASRFLISMLSDNDRLAVVSYGSDVTTETKSLRVTEANKELLVNAVTRIRLSGSTNLSGGFLRGVEEVVPYMRDETINRVMLLSDGRANIGATRVEELSALAAQQLRRGVSVSTMGIGLDYDEKIMTAIAQNGAGNYHFIEDSSSLVGVFEKESKGLNSTVARKTVVTLTVSPGVELLEIRGFPHTMKGNEAKIQLAELFAHQRKDIMVRLGVTSGEAGRVPVLAARVDYEDVAQQKRVHAVTRVSAVSTTNSEKLASVDATVMKDVEKAGVAKSLEDAMHAYERGDRAGAQKVLREQRQRLKKSARDYGFEDDDSVARVDGELQAMEEQVQQAAPSSNDGKRLMKSKRERAYQIKDSVSSF